MANGITSIEMIEAAGRSGMIGFFGAAGLSPGEIETAINRLDLHKDHFPAGFNLIHSPNDPELEAATVQLYLKRGIRCISASAYMDLTLPLVYFRVKGIQRDADGSVVCPNKLIAKVSRVEVARKFFSPPPEKLLAQLVEHKMISSEEAGLAGLVPMAEDLTAEADSGGHTDNRPAISLLPTMLALRDEMAEKYNYDRPLRFATKWLKNTIMTGRYALVWAEESPRPIRLRRHLPWGRPIFLPVRSTSPVWKPARRKPSGICLRRPVKQM